VPALDDDDAAITADREDNKHRRQHRQAFKNQQSTFKVGKGVSPVVAAGEGETAQRQTTTDKANGRWTMDNG
jgi:hypothetical protein